MSEIEKNSKGEFRVALSVSPFTDYMFKEGYTYEDSSGNKAESTEELQRLFVKHGSNEVYVRIATARKKYSTHMDDHSLETALERARLAKKLGLPLNPEIGLFKYYGDVMGQPGPDFAEYPEINVPGNWETLRIDQMAAAIKQYTEVLARELLATGVRVNVWDIGNEVNFGIAGVSVQPFPKAFEALLASDWYHAPDAVNPEIGTQSALSLLMLPNNEMIPWLEKNVWPYQAVLMNAAREGIMEIVPDAKFSTHITFPDNRELALAFYRAMLKGGFKFDVIGFSFYPTASDKPQDRFGAFKETIKSVHKEFNLPAFIGEFAYLAAKITAPPFNEWNHKIEGYELTPEGQAACLQELTSWGAANGICGIRYWAPDIVTPVWGPFSLFSVSGKKAVARQALNSILKGLGE